MDDGLITKIEQIGFAFGLLLSIIATAEIAGTINVLPVEAYIIVLWMGTLLMWLLQKTRSQDNEDD